MDVGEFVVGDFELFVECDDVEFGIFFVDLCDKCVVLVWNVVGCFEFEIFDLVMIECCLIFFGVDFIGGLFWVINGCLFVMVGLGV